MNEYINIQGNEVDINGTIGKGLFTDGYTFERFKTDVKNIKGKVIININSLGGSLSDAFSIYDMIRSMENKVVTKICATSASAATIISLAGDNRYIAENARYLIHKVMINLNMVNSDDIEKVLPELKDLDRQLINLYVSRSKLNYQQVLDLMKQNKFIDAQTAIEYGFIDDIIKDKKEIYNDMDKKLLELFNTESHDDVLSNVLNLIDENNRLKEFTNQSTGDASPVNEEEEVEETEEGQTEEVESTEDETEKSENTDEGQTETENSDEEDEDEKEKLLARIAELEKALEEKQKEEAENRIVEINNYLDEKVKEGRITNDLVENFFDVGSDKGIDYIKNIIEKLPLPKNEKLSKLIETDIYNLSKDELFNKWKSGEISGEVYQNILKNK